MNNARLNHPDLSDLLAAAGIGTWVWNPATGGVSWDLTTQQIYGVEETGFDGTFESYAALIHPDDVAGVNELIASLAARGGEYTTKHRVVQPSGVIRWIEGQGRIVVEDGVATAGFGVVYDVTDRATLEDERDQLRVAERAAQAAKTATEQDLAFLIKVSDALSQLLNVETVLDRLCGLLVPAVADRCTVTVKTSDLPARYLAAYSERDGAEPAAPVDVERHHILLQVDGRIGTAGLASLRNTSALRSDQSEQAEGLAIPLLARGTRIGTMLVERDDGLLTARSEALLRAISRRASSALDTAALFREQLSVSNLLAGSVRPTHLPQTSSFAVAVHYQAAAELARLGGDFYDFFQMSPSKWMLVIGDITGKGMAAAARAGLVRSAVRASAALNNDPAEVLRTINTLMRQEPERPMLSMVAVSLERCEDSHHYVVANAGHPAPFIVSAQGSHQDVGAKGVLIGFLDQPKFQSVSGTLNIGDSLILFSDGGTEARLGPDEYGRDQLIKTVTEIAGAAPEAITKALAASIDAWTGGLPQDDVTLIAATAR